jgi:hypothetical protein
VGRRAPVAAPAVGSDSEDEDADKLQFEDILSDDEKDLAASHAAGKDK